MIADQRPLRILVVSLVDFNNSVHSRPHQLVDYLCRNHHVTALCMNAWWLAKTDGSVLYDTKSYYRGHLRHLKENLRVHYFHNGHRRAVYQEIFSWRAINTLLNNRETGNFDMVINSNTLIAGYYLGRKLSARRIPIVFDIADDIPAMVSVSPHLQPLTRPLARPLAGWFFRKNIEKASRVTYITHALRNVYRLPDSRSVLLPNGVDLRHFKRDKVSNIREKLGLQGKFVLGHIGQLREWVDMETILQAMNLLLKERPDIPLTLLVVGGELELATIKATVKQAGLADKVMFTGIVPYDDMPMYINALDVGIISRKVSAVSNNMFPLKLLEYAACEKPVISTPLAGVREIAGDRVLYAATPEEYKAQIIKLFDSRELCVSMGDHGRKMVEQGYDWEGICSRFEALVRETVEKARLVASLEEKRTG